MSCIYTLPPNLMSDHPEMTCLSVNLQSMESRDKNEISHVEAWYEQRINRIFQYLPVKAPNAKHHDLAVYWLARAALQLIVTAVYEGRLTLQEFSWCRDKIRRWEEDQLFLISDQAGLRSNNESIQDARAWAKAVVRLANKECLPGK